MAINGTPVNFGFTGGAGGVGGITVTGLTGILLQNAEQSKAADVEVVRDGAGNEVSHAWYNAHDEATLEWVVSDATNIAGAITSTTISKIPGSIIVVTACASMPDLVQTNWEVQSPVKASGSNTTAKRISMPLKRFSAITAPAS
jgi:hypothetical protein